MPDALKEWLGANERNEPLALATVVEVTGASPAKVGTKILARADPIVHAAHRSLTAAAIANRSTTTCTAMASGMQSLDRLRARGPAQAVEGNPAHDRLRETPLCAD